MRNLVTIANIVKESITGELTQIEIRDVIVESAFDREGDEYLRINVIYTGAPRNLDPKKISGMVRKLRPKLLELANETAFPVISYISSTEWGIKQVAAA